MHVLSAEQFDQAQLGELFAAADTMRELSASEAARRELIGRHAGGQLCSLFYEPSTRTRLSFEMAANKLGMGKVSTENAREFSSAIKGETLEDTIRVLNEYGCDIIVLRYDETGGAARAASVSEVPIINAGDSKGEHPTQALLDAYTIQKQFGRLHDLHIVMGGDLAHGRTVRSLAHLVSKYSGNRISFVSTTELQIGEDIKAALQASGTDFTETSEMHEAMHDADVVYWTRLQKERLEEHEEPLVIPYGGFTITPVTLEVLPETAIILHPLPRVNEIETSIDADPRAKYFEQAGNGLYVRMALIDHILNNRPSS